MQKTIKNILILGGSGFIGTELISQMVHKYGNDVQIIVPTRKRNNCRNLWVIPQVKLVECAVFEGRQLEQLIINHRIDVVIHSIGILHGKASDYQKIHVKTVEIVIAALHSTIKTKNTKNESYKPLLVYVSGIGAHPNPQLAPSQYLQSKGAAQELIKNSGLSYLILQPSVVFGANDSFLRLFAQLLKHLPVFPLAGSKSKLQPVFVSDVCQALIHCMEKIEEKHPDFCDKTFPVVGPDVYTLQEIVQLVQQKTQHSSKIIPVPFVIGRVQAFLLGLLPLKPMLSQDNLLSLQAPFTELTPLMNLGVDYWNGLDSVCTDYLKPQHDCDVLRMRDLKKS